MNTKSNRIPKVSVITCSYNLAKFIEETIESIANQDYENFEYIIIDGNSNDNSVEIIKKYPNIILVSEKDTGYPDAFWKGLKLARGEYIMQCCVSDCYATKEWIRKCVEILDNNKDVSLVWGSLRCMNEDGKLTIIPHPYSEFQYSGAPEKQEMFNYWLNTKFAFPEANLCVRKNVALKCYPSVEDCKKNILDWLEFSYRFNSLGYISMYIPILAHLVRNHSDQFATRLNREGKMKLMVKDYYRKTNLFRIKLLIGITKHNFIDSCGGGINISFDKKNYVISMMKYFLKINKKFLQPRKYLDFIKRKLKR